VIHKPQTISHYNGFFIIEKIYSYQLNYVAELLN